MLLLFSRPEKSLNTTAGIILVEKMAEKEGQEKEQVDTQVTGVNVTSESTFNGIEKIFERAEFERRRDNAEEKLLELVHEKIDPIMTFGLDYDEFYDDFVLEGEWYDWDQDEFTWVGNLQYFVKYRDAQGNYFSDEKLEEQVDAILEDLKRRIAERDARSPSATGGEYENDDEERAEEKEVASDD